MDLGDFRKGVFEIGFRYTVFLLGLGFGEGGVGLGVYFIWESL